VLIAERKGKVKNKIKSFVRDKEIGEEEERKELAKAKDKRK
jgi:hypothetical protein